MNFLEPAEMYTGRPALKGKILPYRRFRSLAAAVRYAIEQQPDALHCTTIETEDDRLQNKQIQAAYESDEFREAITAAE